MHPVLSSYTFSDLNTAVFFKNLMYSFSLYYFMFNYLRFHIAIYTSDKILS